MYIVVLTEATGTSTVAYTKVSKVDVAFCSQLTHTTCVPLGFFFYGVQFLLQSSPPQQICCLYFFVHVLLSRCGISRSRSLTFAFGKRGNKGWHVSSTCEFWLHPKNKKIKKITPKSSDPVVRRFFDFVTYRFANTVDVKLERHSFRSFLFGRFRVTRGQAGRRGMQSPGRRRPTESKQVQKVSFLLRVTFCSCPGSLTQAESWLWGCRWRHSKLRCYL